MIPAIDSLQRLVGLAVAVAVALLLAYLLRPRRRQVEVPFSGLWQRVLQRRDARSLGRRWQRWLSLLLMVAIAGLLWGALAQPLLRPQDTAGPVARWSTVLVVDRSASMATRDGQCGDGALCARFDEAREAVVRWLDATAEDEDVLLMAASGHAEVLGGWGSDKTALQRAVQTVEVTDGGLDWAGALDTATQMLRGRRGARIVLVSDGGLPLAAAPTATVDVQRIWVGPLRSPPRAVAAAAPLAAASSTVALDDLAVVDARLRAQADDPDRGVLTVRVRNDAQRTIAARLVVCSAADAQLPAEFAADRALRRLVEVTIPAGESLHRIDGLDLIEGRFAVRVEGREASTDGGAAWRDVAPWNDWGFAVLASQRRLKVLRVGSPNRFIEGALAALGRVDVVNVAAEDYQPQHWQAVARGRHGIDLAVLDQVDAPPPTGLPALVLALQPPADATASARLLSGPEILVRAGDHPAMRNVSFQDTNFDQVRVLAVGPLDETLAAATLGGGRSAAVMVARHGTVRRLDWGIDLLQTDLVGRYALPILLANAVAFLAGEEDGVSTPLELGRPWAVEAAVRGGKWQYLEPGQRPRPARQSAGQLLAASEIHGLHVWRDDMGREEARPSVMPASERAASVQRDGMPHAPRPRPPVRNGPAMAWPHFAVWLLAGLLALAGEWWLYLRRRTV